jgi:hypothetical protein
MTESDKEFLLWIAKRLVYKYGEKPDIITQVMGLLNRDRTEKNAYQENVQNTLLFISTTIDSLTNMQKICTNLSINNVTKSTENNNLSLDNIDMDNFIRGI